MGIECRSNGHRMGIVSLGQVIVSVVVLIVAVVVVRLTELRHVDQTQHERLAITALAVVEQLVLPLIAALGPVDQDVFQLDQTHQSDDAAGSRPSQAPHAAHAA